MQDIVFSFNFLTLSLLFCLIFPIYCFILRKQIFFWFDPLLAFIFFNSVSITLVTDLYFFRHEIKVDYLVSFCLCIVGFVLGIMLGGRKGLPKWNFKKTNDAIKNSTKHYSLLLDIFLVICILIMVFSNLLLLIFKGTLPIFSANPSEAKITLYTGGWGFVKRINFSLVNYVLAIPLIKIFHPNIKTTSKQTLFYIGCIFTCVLVLLSMGSKSNLFAITNILFAIVMVNKTYGVSTREQARSLLNEIIILKWTKYVFILAIVFIFVVVALSGVETSATDSVITRLVASGDVFYFFYVFDIASDFHKTALDYIPHILNPVLGMLRLTDYEFSIGVYTLHYAIGLPMDAFAVFGPNSQPPIEGLIYFGKYGACIYSFLIGYIISFIRIGLLRKMGPYPNYLFIVIYIVLSSLVVIMGSDVPLFMQVFYDLVIYGTIILILSATLLPALKATVKNES